MLGLKLNHVSKRGPWNQCVGKRCIDLVCLGSILKFHVWINTHLSTYRQNMLLGTSRGALNPNTKYLIQDIKKWSNVLYVIIGICHIWYGLDLPLKCPFWRNNGKFVVSSKCFSWPMFLSKEMNNTDAPPCTFISLLNFWCKPFGYFVYVCVKII